MKRRKAEKNAAKPSFLPQNEMKVSQSDLFSRKREKNAAKPSFLVQSDLFCRKAIFFLAKEKKLLQSRLKCRKMNFFDGNAEFSVKSEFSVADRIYIGWLNNS